MHVFDERGKPEYPGENLSLRAEKRTNKLNPHMTPSLEIEPGPHWWEESALTTTPPLLSENWTHALQGGATLTKAIFKVITRASMDFPSWKMGPSSRS